MTFTRRAFLAATATVGSGCLTRGSEVDRTIPTVTGSIYFPTSAYTHYQTWADFDPGIVARDVGYAARLNLDAMRIIVGWEYWRDHPDRFRRAFDMLLSITDWYGIHVLPVLFESVGREPTMANLTDRNVETAVAAQSPGQTVIEDESKWDGPRRFTRWFTERYTDEIVAIEVMNEPCGWDQRTEFCRAMLREVRSVDQSVPITVGCKRLELNERFEEPSLDIYQFHLNDPADTGEMEDALDRAAARSVPVWLTEWQRTIEVPPPLSVPNYSSLAPTVRAGEISGDFFWQLMIKPAYVAVSRDIDRFTGIFHEDGVVYSRADAETISGASFERERRSNPYDGKG